MQNLAERLLRGLQGYDGYKNVLDKRLNQSPMLKKNTNTVPNQMINATIAKKFSKKLGANALRSASLHIGSLANVSMSPIQRMYLNMP